MNDPENNDRGKGDSQSKIDWTRKHTAFLNRELCFL